jgi:chromosome segregation ATPase
VATSQELEDEVYDLRRTVDDLVKRLKRAERVIEDLRATVDATDRKRRSAAALLGRAVDPDVRRAGQELG